MKVRVKTAFKDKNTNQVYKVGDELEMSVHRVNEVLTVGSFIELVEQENEHTEKPEEVPDQETGEGQDNADQNGEGQEGDNQETGEAPKQTGRRKRTNK